MRTATHGHGADVILDIMGGAYLARNVEALATGGRLVVIGLQGGREAEFDLGQLMTKRASVTAAAAAPRPAPREGGHRRRGRGARLAADRSRDWSGRWSTSGCR